MGAISKRKRQSYGTAPLLKFLRKANFLKIRKSINDETNQI
nr:MAG TPA: hypothetical protein [Caudoviricetes sp.]